MKETYIKKSDSPAMGDSHRFVTDKGEISLVYPIYYTSNTYEIYCISGELFEDVERFDTLDEAIARITSLLT